MGGPAGQSGVPLRDRLLRSTLKNAWAKPFYRDFWGGVVSQGANGELRDGPASIEGLSMLPLLDRDTYRASYMHAAPASPEGTLISHTKGTSGEDLLWRYRTVAEQRVIAELFGKAWVGPACIALSMRWPQHGMGMPIPTHSLVIPGNPHVANGLQQALRVLETEHRFGATVMRPSVLSGHAAFIADLADLVREEGARERLAVSRIFMAGDLNPSRFDTVHHSFPAATVSQKYSLSEIFGGASRSAPTEPYRLDAYVVGEVVDEDGRPVQPGAVGELVMTELFPFVQHQPLVRYRTGDLVRRVSDSASSLTFTYERRIRQIT